ncbi:AAA family ATPase [Peribacillus frigoritolerans]|uniref:AAA family ATPase n=1 Tax=Peribacillus frigoritolerans TaxID=450367 RepID=UPI0021D23E35|nr:AAA family ATPase [Peribacillus frigoritolerans]MCU6603931.1 AAA family ATPase [Peribacillus frigoritolerans]
MENIEPLVIGFGGKIGSGKTTIAQTICLEFNYKYASFGDYVRKIAINKGLDIKNRENLQKVGNLLIDGGVEKFCRNVLDSVKWNPGETLVIEGIRHKEVLHCLKDLTYKDRFIFVLITLDDDVRKKRIKNLDKEEFHKLDFLEKDRTEMEIQKDLQSCADIVVINETEPSKVITSLMGRIGKKYSGRC